MWIDILSILGKNTLGYIAILYWDRTACYHKIICPKIIK